MSFARLRKRLRQAAIRLLVNCVVPLVRVLRKAEEEYDSRLMRKTIEGFSSAGIGLNIDGSATITDPKAVSIGNNVFIGADTFVMSEGGLRIGDNTHISRRVTIYCSDHRFRHGEGVPYGAQRTWKQVTIGTNVWIGMNACILPGVTIGDGAIVGMGAIVAKDVPPRAIVGQPPFRVLGERSSADYEDAIARQRIGGRNGAILTGERLRSYRARGRSHPPDICFILTTGRSGSTTIADALNAHPRICARHEPRQQLIKWSTEFAHGELDRDTLRQMLSEMFLDASFYDRDTVYVESDQKYFNLVPILDELFPACKFIWLIRSALAVVPSTVGRSWYADERHPTWQAIPWYWHYYRLRGDACGAVSPDEWSAMSAFEKNCWYWSHVNGVIERDLSGIPADRKFVMRLEDFAHERAKIFRFLGVEPVRTRAVKSNQAFHGKYSPSTWSREDRIAFSNWCGPLMSQLYSDDYGLQKAS